MAGLLAGFAVPSAWAQSSAGLEIAAEAVTDQRERGLSWSDGKPTVGASASLAATDLASVRLDVWGLRDSARHGGADLGLSIAPRLALSRSALSLGVGARGNVFVGRGGLSYLELTADSDYTIGPARIGASAAYAPSQAAIGGQNLHLAADVSVGLPATPFTVYGGVGYTVGTKGRRRSARLRPGGDYGDHRLGVQYARSAITLGLEYSDTTIRRREVDVRSPFYDRHYGARVTAYLRVTR